ncbi:hypothetical protein [Streptosporangium vulgare]|uniref:hypothetical protein n=1 Tax=Streptosporangium vulgare TaxID=46190 RepID=UPI0031D1DBB4
MAELDRADRRHIDSELPEGGVEIYALVFGLSVGFFFFRGFFFFVVGGFLVRG